LYFVVLLAVPQNIGKNPKEHFAHKLNFLMFIHK